MELTVVIPTLGDRPSLGRVVEGFERQSGATDFEVIVALDAAAPGDGALDAWTGPSALDVRHTRGDRPGASAARNAGWRAATAPLVLFVDDDTIPSPELVAEHLAWHRDEPDETVGVLGHVRWAPELRLTPFMRWLDQGFQFDYPNIEGTEAGFGRLYTANASLKRGLLERLGGFDEVRFPFNYEDIDLGRRADELGFRLLYNPNALVDHLREPTLEEWCGRMPGYARAERRFVELYPELEPYFKRMFEDALEFPPAVGRGLSLARFVPESVPWLGWRVWASVDRYYKQTLAPHFLAAWDSDAGLKPGGSSPGGPK